MSSFPVWRLFPSTFFDAFNMLIMLFLAIGKQIKKRANLSETKANTHTLYDEKNFLTTYDEDD